MHVWGDAQEDWAYNPIYQDPVYDTVPFHWGNPGITNPEWIEGSAADPNNTGINYFDGPGEYGNTQSWDLNWKLAGLTQPASQPKGEATGPAGGTKGPRVFN